MRSLIRISLSFLLGFSFVATARAGERCGEVSGDGAALDAAWERIEALCGCAVTDGSNARSAAREFAKCARGVATRAVLDGDLRSRCRSRLLAGVRHSVCARPPGWMTCCLTNRRGRTSCRARRSADQCTSSASRFATSGSTGTCLDACAEVTGPACWRDADCDDGNACTVDRCAPTGLCSSIEITGCVPGGDTTCTGNGAQTHELSSEEQILLAKVNQYRATRGAPAVLACSSLSRAAQDHAADMRNRGYFSHRGENGSTFPERACDAGYLRGCGPTTWMGEIIAGGNPTGVETLDQWVNSSGHRAILSSSDFIVAGIGHACGGSFGHYWVMVFGGAGEASCE